MNIFRLPRLTNGCTWHGYRIVKTRTAWKAVRNGQVVYVASRAAELAERIHWEQIAKGTP